MNNNFTPEELVTEEWRDIEGYNGRYQVSNLGRVRSIIVTILNPTVKGSTGGYARASLYDGASKTPNVQLFHWLVAKAFLGPRPDGFYVNHKDANKLNNRAENLEYVTPARNTQHASEMGRLLTGAQHKSSKLTDEKVAAILNRLAAGESIYKIAPDFNVSAVLIGRILKGKIWRHVPRPDSPRLKPVDYEGHRRGNDSYNAKLTEEQVREIRHRYAIGNVRLQDLADTYSIGKSQVKRIIDRETWKHVL